MENQILISDNVNQEELKFYQSVIILNCGGTINMVGASERKPSDAVKTELLKINKKFSEINISYQLFDVFERPPDSSNIQNKDWDKIFTKVFDILKEKKRIENKLKIIGAKYERGGIVITHGTDTLQLTGLAIAYRLCLIHYDLPIIFTASHSPIGEPGSDASENIQKTIFAAKEKFFDEENNLPAGVYALIGQEIHIASRISKIYTMPNSEGKYFFSFPTPAAKITMGKKFKIKVSKDFISRITFNSEFHQDRKLKEEYNWGIVEHIILDKFSSIEVLKAFKRRVGFYNSLEEYEKTKIGIIIQGNFINNNYYNDFENLIIELTNSGVILFLGSKEVYRTITSKYENINIGLIHKSISHSKARLKLSWLLRLNINTEHIIKLMNQNLVGDIFETDELPEWINYETFPDNIEGHEIILVYPNIHPRIFTDTINKFNNPSTTLSKINIYGFGDGHIPTTNDSLINIINKFFVRENINPIVMKRDPAIDEITEFCVQIVGKQITSQYLNNNYIIDENHLSNIIKREIVQKIREEHIEILEKVFSEMLSEFQSNKLIKIKNQDEIQVEFLKNTKLQIRKEEIDKKYKDIIEKYNGNYFKILIEYLPQYVIKRILKDSLMYECKLLQQIGIAIDKGIKFFINTTAVKSNTNTLLYENGNKLMILGVDSNVSKGWETSYMKRKHLE